MFVAIEFANGGRDLEHKKLKNAEQGLSIFLQIAHALASKGFLIHKGGPVNFIVPIVLPI